MCLVEIGPQPIHPTSGLPVFLEAIDGSVVYGVSGGSVVSRWTWPGLAYIDDYMTTSGTSAAVTIDDDGNVYVGVIDGQDFDVYKNGAGWGHLGAQASMTVSGWSGGGLTWEPTWGVWASLSYEVILGEVGRLYSFTEDGGIGAPAVQINEGGSLQTGPYFNVEPNLNVDRSAIFWSGGTTTNVWRADIASSTYFNNAAMSAVAFMYALDNGNMIGWSAAIAGWREWENDSGVGVIAASCDPAALGFASFPIGGFQNAAMTVRGLIDSDGIVWANRRGQRWWAGVAGWT